MLAAFLLLATILVAGPVDAAEDAFDRLDPNREWLVGQVRLEGNATFSDTELRDRLLTRERSVFTPWRSRPRFDPTSFERDVTRLRRFYESEGFFLARIDWQWSQIEKEEKSIVELEISIDEGPRAEVSRFEIAVASGDDTKPDKPFDPQSVVEDARTGERWEPELQLGRPFREEGYLGVQAEIERIFLNRGHALVAVERKATVHIDRLGVEVDYRVVPGPSIRFGPTQIEGNARVDKTVITREILWMQGESFSIDQIEATRNALMALDLFGTVRMRVDRSDVSDGEVPIEIVLREKPAREFRVGVGYSTEEQARVQARWRNHNWLGGGRRLSIGGKYSSIYRSADFSLIQPHFLAPKNSGLIAAKLFQEAERTFTRTSISLVPALERRLAPDLVGQIGFRVEWAQVRDVELEVEQLIGGVRDDGRVFGPRLSLTWSPVDDLFHPSRGHIIEFEIEHASRIWGGTYDYYKSTLEFAEFMPIADWVVLAGRLKVGVADSIGGPPRLPIFERFYAGGERSVRGYQRRQLGPRASNGDAIGGRSLVEGAIEMRIPVWQSIGVVGFVDFGQVSLDRFDLVPDDLRYSAGPGVTYETPVGPLAFFMGFPINDQRGEPSWQIHFSVGFFF
jgi:outer membrane protein assembly complex protein YaeT